MATVLFRFSVFSIALFQIAAAAGGGSYSRVKFLPGFSGPLPFVLETGYVGVGDSEEVQLFYYFVESEGNPQTDPLLLLLPGGPGCSALSGLAFEIGPISFKEELYNGSVPELILDPHSWTKKSSIIFVDLPMGTGFSYSTTSEDRKPGDFNQIHHALQFLRKWLVDHPKFISNPFYVVGVSYSGIIVPILVQEILEGNKHIFPFINFKGYILGNPFTIRGSNENFAIPFAHSKTLISDELFESLKTSCKGEYVNIDPSNVECLRNYNTYQKTYKHLLSYDWANNDQVQRALHIHEGSIGEWIRCKKKDYYQYEIKSVFPYHVNLSSKGYRSLIYSGDHDMIMPSMDTSMDQIFELFYCR